MFVYVDENGIGQTNDMFITKDIAYSFVELGAKKPRVGGFLQHGSGLYCFVASESDRREFIKFPVIADTAEPKTRFRVFKESF